MADDAGLTPAQMWTVEQTAEYLGFSKGHIRALITQRKLPALRIGTVYRIDPADVERFIQRIDVAEHTTEAAAR